MTQFGREYRLSAGAAGGTGFEIGETSEERPVALHISFMVDKCDTETPNDAKISIWNLNPEQVAILNQDDCLVVLKAGYGNHLPLIFAGYVTKASTVMDGADRETSLEIVDGATELRDTYISVSFTGATNGRIIAERIAEEMGVALMISHNAAFYTFDKFSFVGLGRVALDKVCESSGLQWGIHNGVLQIKRIGDTMSRNVYVLSPETGMIGIPSRVMIAAGASGEEQPGWEVNSLLNGAIGISDYVRVESRYVSGYFRVATIATNGDNLEGDWLNTIFLVDV